VAFLVRVVFAVPAASSKRKRVFSVAGLKSRLNPGKVENIVTVKCNLPLLKEMGVQK
jgi:hypothetical protein